jgi:amino acid permease
VKKNIISLTIMLIAGIIVSLIGTISQFELNRFILTLLITLIVFFSIGHFIQVYIIKVLTNDVVAKSVDSEMSINDETNRNTKEKDDIHDKDTQLIQDKSKKMTKM